MIKFSALLFFLLQGMLIYSYAEDRRELEEEIEQLLKDKYDWSTTENFSIKNYALYKVTDDQYIEGLKKLKTALQKTENVQSFRNVGSILLSNQETVSSYNVKGKIYLYFPVKRPPEAWIELLSSDPENEPELQKYKTSIEQKLKEQFGDWYNFHKAGEKILCEHKSSLRDTEKITKIASRLIGKSVVDVELAHDYNYKRYILINFSDPPPARIEILVDSFRFKKVSYVQIDNKEDGLFSKGGELTKSWFTADCNFIEAEIWEYDSEGNLWRKHWLDADGDIEKTVFVNRKVMSLPEIYYLHDHPNKSLEEALDVANGVDRILVTILDSGVDYNHPELAYKIVRPDETSLKTIKNQLAKLRSQRDAIQERFERRSKIGKLVHGLVYKAKLSSITKDIRETEERLAEEEKMSAVGWDFEDDDAQPYDYVDDIFSIIAGYDHGTHVAGIAAQGSDDIAILPVRYPGEKKERFYQAIQYSHARGSRIVNISLGSNDIDDWEALDRAMEDHPDMLFVVSAGNDGQNIDVWPRYPASLDHFNMLVVAATNENGELADFSNYGKSSVDVAAPGEDILSTEPEGSTGEKSGTSMAAPYVTRVAAKIKAINPRLTPRQIIAIIRNSVEKTPELQMKLKYGGIVNENRALELARFSLE